MTPIAKTKVGGNLAIGEKIAVCLLTYNHVDVIESTIKSVLTQTVTGYEVIVSDDCSTDGTWERIQALAEEDKRIRPVRTPHNMGMAGNANHAVAQTKRPYIALLHHDDIYREDLLEKWTSVLERNPHTAFVFNPYGVYESDFVYQEPMPGECIDGDWLLNRYLFAQWGCVVRGTAMIRRSAWVQVGGMREHFGLLSDIDLWMRLAKRWSVGYVPEPLIMVRHQRPSYYPAIYAGKEWSWNRRRHLHEIHATNRVEYYDLGTLGGRLRWFGFRLRLNLDTAKWLTYALLRKKWSMIESSHLSESSFDFGFLSLYRHTLRKLAGQFMQGIAK